MQWIIKGGIVIIALMLATTLGYSAGVIGKATGPFDSQGAQNPRVAESSLGNLLADASREAVGAQLALAQAAQLRPVTIPAGDLTAEILTGALLYPDEKLVLVEVPGAQLQAALERSLTMLPKPNTGFLQVSGMTVTFRSNAPEGQRLADVTIAGQKLDPARRYQVAMPESLAKGQLGYFRVFDGLKPKQTGPAIGDALVSYVSARPTVAPQTGRLKDLAPVDEKS